MTAPLEGIRVLELANFAAAPSAAAIMADLGAEVVKVEPIAGDAMWGTMRQARMPEGQPNPDHPMQFVNRGKRSVAIAIDTDDGAALVRRLISSSDVVITNLLPGRRSRYGLAPADLLAIKDDLVVGVLTGYGEEGDEIDRPGFDVTAFFSRSGLAGLPPDPSAGPVKFRPAQGDHTTGLALFGGIMAALRARDLGGGGQVVEASLLRAATWTAAFDLVTALVDGRSATPRNRRESVSAMAEAYPCADGRWIQLAMVHPTAKWPAFCTAIERPELIDHEVYGTPKGRFDHMAELIDLLDDVFRTRTLVEWGERLDAEGCVWAPVNTPAEATVDPQVRATGAFETVDHPDGPFETVAVPFRMPGADVGVRGPYLGRGADTDDVLSDLLGLDASELDRLRGAGAIGG
ncbi:MAG: CoA transferase [Actinomycetota bacterium]|nr:CoA transferase [Actinomycetota bacterium]